MSNKNKVVAVKATYNATKNVVSLISPKTGTELWLPFGTSWDGETAHSLRVKVKRACVEAAGQFGKDFVSGGTTLEMTVNELFTWKEAYNNMVDHFTP